MTNKEIARLFSAGEFKTLQSCLADNIEWITLGEGANHLVGKGTVIACCEELTGYFKSLTTNFYIENIISENNKVAINGSAEFIKNLQRINFVKSCDVYEFTSDNKIQKITSYCISLKVN